MAFSPSCTTPSRWDIVLFDLGSTLIYCDKEFSAMLPQAIVPLADVLAQAGYTFDPAHFSPNFQQHIQRHAAARDADLIERTMNFILRDTLEDYGYTNLPQEVVVQALKAMYAVTQQYWHREEDTCEMLQTLRSQGYRLGIVSNAGDDNDVQRLVDCAGIRGYFDMILSSAVAGVRKPHPHIFEQALAHWNADPAQAIMVGDMLGADALGANRLGMGSVWITRRALASHNQPLQGKITPLLTIDTLRELPERLAAFPKSSV